MLCIKDDTIHSRETMTSDEVRAAVLSLALCLLCQQDGSATCSPEMILLWLSVLSSITEGDNKKKIADAFNLKQEFNSREFNATYTALPDNIKFMGCVLGANNPLDTFIPRALISSVRAGEMTEAESFKTEFSKNHGMEVPITPHADFVCVIGAKLQLPWSVEGEDVQVRFNDVLRRGFKRSKMSRLTYCKEGWKCVIVDPEEGKDKGDASETNSYTEVIFMQPPTDFERGPNTYEKMVKLIKKANAFDSCWESSTCEVHLPEMEVKTTINLKESLQLGDVPTKEGVLSVAQVETHLKMDKRGVSAQGYCLLSTSRSAEDPPMIFDKSFFIFIRTVADDDGDDHEGTLGCLSFACLYQGTASDSDDGSKEGRAALKRAAASGPEGGSNGEGGLKKAKADQPHASNPVSGAAKTWECHVAVKIYDCKRDGDGNPIMNGKQQMVHEKIPTTARYMYNRTHHQTFLASMHSHQTVKVFLYNEALLENMIFTPKLYVGQNDKKGTTYHQTTLAAGDECYELPAAIEMKNGDEECRWVVEDERGQERITVVMTLCE